jgi:hypothetical protein
MMAAAAARWPDEGMLKRGILLFLALRSDGCALERDVMD